MKCAAKYLCEGIGSLCILHLFHRAQAQIRPARQLNGQRDSAKTTWLRCSAKAPSTSSSGAAGPRRGSTSTAATAPVAATADP